MKKGTFDLKNKSLIFAVFVILFSVISCNQQEIRFYKAEQVFHQFEMTTEYHDDLNAYKNAFEQRMQNFENQLDSLKRDFKVETDEKSKQLLYFKIADFQKSFDKELENGQNVLQQKIEKGDQEIWTRINSYLAEYCKEQNIHLLMDVGNMVTTPYYDKTHDLTEECSTYINKKYNEVLKD